MHRIWPFAEKWWSRAWRRQGRAKGQNAAEDFLLYWTIAQKRQSVRVRDMYWVFGKLLEDEYNGEKERLRAKLGEAARRWGQWGDP